MLVMPITHPMKLTRILLGASVFALSSLCVHAGPGIQYWQKPAQKSEAKSQDERATVQQANSTAKQTEKSKQLPERALADSSHS